MKIKLGQARIGDQSGISIACRLRKYNVNKRKVAVIARAVCDYLGVRDHELSVNMVSSKVIQDLNKRFRGIDQPTDILSFPQREWSRLPRVSAKAAFRDVAAKLVSRGAKRINPLFLAETLGPKTLGDLVISLQDAEKNAERIGHGLDRELCFLMVHGILHLCGYDHEDLKQEKVMCAAQRRLMAFLSTMRSGSTPVWTHCVKRTV